jgi:hypothetical protein
LHAVTEVALLERCDESRDVLRRHEWYGVSGTGISGALAVVPFAERGHVFVVRRVDLSNRRGHGKERKVDTRAAAVRSGGFDTLHVDVVTRCAIELHSTPSRQEDATGRVGDSVGDLVDGLAVDEDYACFPHHFLSRVGLLLEGVFSKFEVC